MSSFTPGPWKAMWSGRGNMVSHHVSATAPAIPGFCGERSIEVARVSAIDPQTENANSLLISAAPDLLSAAYLMDETAERFMEFDPDSRVGEAIAALRTAISKAEGKSHD